MSRLIIYVFHFEDCNSNRSSISDFNRQNRSEVLLSLSMSRRFLKTKDKILCVFKILSQGVPVGDNPVTEREFPDISSAMFNEHFVSIICGFVNVRQVYEICTVNINTI